MFGQLEAEIAAASLVGQAARKKSKDMQSTPLGANGPDLLKAETAQDFYLHSKLSHWGFSQHITFPGQKQVQHMMMWG